MSSLEIPCKAHPYGSAACPTSAVTGMSSTSPFRLEIISSDPDPVFCSSMSPDPPIELENRTARPMSTSSPSARGSGLVIMNKRVPKFLGYTATNCRPNGWRAPAVHMVGHGESIRVVSAEEMSVHGGSISVCVESIVIRHKRLSRSDKVVQVLLFI